MMMTSLFVQRIGIEREFIDDAMQRAVPFVKLGILPERVGKWFTRQKTTLKINEEQIARQPDVSIHNEKEVWCYFKKEKVTEP